MAQGRAVGTLRFEPLASWSDGGPENLISKDQINLSAPVLSSAYWQYVQYKVKFRVQPGHYINEYFLTLSLPSIRPSDFNSALYDFSSFEAHTKR
ncbi:hypothetical protein PoB_003936100 [Plakobranchus ocellatus]|uniref:Uncharacterized protein n=1 Tax=Plakobranchus ocellatus TaxID=259542 RepID=A0AAV4B211_9GAST|nr:hypothetical protein PoB_003936100 [Plakobranchus ocellatus]